MLSSLFLLLLCFHGRCCSCCPCCYIFTVDVVVVEASDLDSSMVFYSVARHILNTCTVGLLFCVSFLV